MRASTIRHLVATFLAVAAVVLGSAVLSGYSHWPTTVRGEIVFPPTTSLFQNMSDGVQGSGYSLFDSSPGRFVTPVMGVEKRRFENSILIRVGDETHVTFRLTARTDDRIVLLVSEGGFRTNPQWFVSSFIGNFSSSHGRTEYPQYDWSPPTVDRGNDGRATITVTAKSIADPEFPLRLEIGGGPCNDHRRCEISMELRTDGTRTITAVRPDDRIVTQTGTALTIDRLPEALRVEVDDRVVDRDAARYEIPIEITSQLDRIWRYIALFGPWVFLFAWYRHRRRSGSADSAPWHRGLPKHVVSIYALLLAASLLPMVFDTGTAVVSLADRGLWSWSDDLDYDDPLRSGLPVDFPEITAPLMGLTALWAWRMHSIIRDGFSFEHRSTKVLATLFAYALRAAVISCGIAAIALVAHALYHQPAPPQMFTRSASIGWAALGVGVFLTLSGCLYLSTRVASSRGAIVDGLCAASLVAGTALAEPSSFDSSKHVAAAAGVLTAIVMLIFTATLVLATLTLIVHGASEPNRMPWWSIPLATLFALAFSMPTENRNYLVFPVSTYDLLNVIYSLEPLFRLGLLVAVLLVLLIWSEEGFPYHHLRPIAVGVMVLFALRPDLTLLESPIPLLVGYLLVTRFLLIGPRRTRIPHLVFSDRTRLIGDRDRILQETSQFVSRMTDEALLREEVRGLRKKLATGDGSSVEGPHSRGAVQATIATNQGLLSSHDVGPGLDWGGVARPWNRGVRGALAGTVVGMVFFVPHLTEALTIIYQFTGTSPWRATLDALLVFRFPWYGFAFGYLLPMIRGRSAAGKALKYFLVLGTSEIIGLAIQMPSFGDAVRPSLLLLSQLFLLCAVLGIGFDLSTLKNAGYGIDQLADLYHTNKVALWSSSLALTAATALVTALAGSATTVLIERAMPPAPPPTSQSSTR